MPANFRDYMLAGLIQHNFLPTQKKDKGEIPGILSTNMFDTILPMCLTLYLKEVWVMIR
jgi:hypothetical protein